MNQFTRFEDQIESAQEVESPLKLSELSMSAWTVLGIIFSIAFAYILLALIGLVDFFLAEKFLTPVQRGASLTSLGFVFVFVLMFLLDKNQANKKSPARGMIASPPIPCTALGSSEKA